MQGNKTIFFLNKNKIHIQKYSEELDCQLGYVGQMG